MGRINKFEICKTNCNLIALGLSSGAVLVYDRRASKVVKLYGHPATATRHYCKILTFDTLVKRNYLFF